MCRIRTVDGNALEAWETFILCLFPPLYESVSMAVENQRSDELGLETCFPFERVPFATTQSKHRRSSPADVAVYSFGASTSLCALLFFDLWAACRLTRTSSTLV